VETRTRIKICGITNLEDARAAVDYGADALGFILVPESPRYIGHRDATHIADQLPPYVSRTAVLVNASHRFKPLLLGLTFDTIQFYEIGSSLGLHTDLRRVHAFRIKDESSLDMIGPLLKISCPNALLLDAYHPDKLGGSGETFNWELAREAKERFQKPIILAGGLTPENVGDAIATVRPYAVDVSSGVEATPGRKDHAKLRAFLRAVRKADEAIR